jgi:hypothetical protein
MFSFLYNDGNLQTIHKKEGLYCVEKMKNRKKIYETIEPQPPTNQILTIQRLYNTLNVSEEGTQQFKRRCTWIVSRPDNLTQLPLDVAVVEYIGTFPERKRHGSAKSASAPFYIRTKPGVQSQLSNLLKTQTVKSVEQTMNKMHTDYFSKQRNEKQLRNIKYTSMKSNNSVPSNPADQIMCVEEMTNTHELVYSVKHLKGINQPVITLMSNQQITDLKRFFATGKTLLGVDKTYNLGEFYVTRTITPTKIFR